MERIIKQVSELDVLNDIWNLHLKSYMQLKIDHQLLQNFIKAKGEKETAWEKPIQQPNAQGQMMVVGVQKVKAVDALKENAKSLQDEKDILDVIVELTQEKNDYE